jgi:hypothetical protein
MEERDDASGPRYSRSPSREYRPGHSRLALRFRWISLGLVLFTSIAWAQAGVTELRKPFPDAQAQPYRERLETLIKARYPELLTHKERGSVLVTVLLNSDGALADTKLDIQSGRSGPLTASEMQFTRFGLSAGDLKYIGVTRLQLGVNWVSIVFGARDSRSIDRALVERYFPKALTKGLPPGEGIWILFDHSGRVLRTGQEPFEHGNFKEQLTKRYPGIRIGDAMDTLVYGPNGDSFENSNHEPLQLHSLWLTEDSPLPEGSALPAPR